MAKQKLQKKQEKLGVRDRVVYVVTTIWAMTVIADMVIPGYEVSPMVHGLMTGIVGYLFADRLKNGNGLHK